MHQSLDIYYIQEKLRFYFEALHFQRVRNVEIDTGISEVILAIISESSHLKIPTITTYYHAYLLLKYPSEEINFIQLQKTLKNSFTLVQLRQLVERLIKKQLYRKKHRG